MNHSVLWNAFRWPVNLLEAVTAVAAILAIGAVIAVTAFWLLHRAVGKLAGPSLEAEPPADGGDDPASPPSE